MLLVTWFWQFGRMTHGTAGAAGVGALLSSVGLTTVTHQDVVASPLGLQNYSPISRISVPSAIVWLSPIWSPLHFLHHFKVREKASTFWDLQQYLAIGCVSDTDATQFSRLQKSLNQDRKGFHAMGVLIKNIISQQRKVSTGNPFRLLCVRNVPCRTISWFRWEISLD